VVAVVPPVQVHAQLSAAETQALWKQLDNLSKDLNSSAKESASTITVGTVAGLSTTLLSVGYVIWAIRGGSLLVTLLTTLPLWRWLDPLPVLESYERRKHPRDESDKENDADEERIRTMIE
jgi:hypothetical protein